MTRADAIERAHRHLHSGDFIAELKRRVAYPTESQNRERSEVLQAYHLRRLGLERFTRMGLTERVMGWRKIYDAHEHTHILTLPHPSWRNTGWLKRNPWFAEELLPVLRADVARLL